MKVFYGILGIMVFLGVVFYSLHESVSSRNVVNASVKKTTAKKAKKDCHCCKEKSAEALALVRQQLKDNEKWAQDIIETHGYEEGMRQITDRSSVLANRMQHLIEKANGITSDTTSQTQPSTTAE